MVIKSYKIYGKTEAFHKNHIIRLCEIKVYHKSKKIRWLRYVPIITKKENRFAKCNKKLTLSNQNKEYIYKKIKFF